MTAHFSMLPLLASIVSPVCRSTQSSFADFSRTPTLLKRLFHDLTHLSVLTSSRNNKTEVLRGRYRARQQDRGSGCK